ncbi:PP2C family serine/threonine-protein phosphatase [Salinibius halmophilus]|uniref:PP2C family serine/threonine-protein phosphatase n=1 Tax=Salinibius halmophilus TaxID=1853216 RepID=UPI000E65F13B|nr:PP2C family serine/threonine-protein phosphatase [Salinibius halmophilus]
MRLLASSATVIGPAHTQDGLPNQDAHVAKGFRGGCFAAVADGLGSRPLSHLGSAAAVTLARELSPHNCKPSQLSEAWKASFENEFDLYETTCLWAWVNDQGYGSVHQAGDGLVLARTGGKFQVLSPENQLFGNQTTTLAQATNELAMNADIKLTKAGDGLLLMTDGISDDLVAEHLESFFEVIYQYQKSRSRRRMKRWLASELEQWSTPLHGDDKSIACILRMD